ncbi:DUF3043 domain-containing protein [Yinghuangia seranimata]|uniref:DUF3043 domain-containing protein n=1 Tax=Yinghuangia seranimata TaxID=408067 RepID=UPI00248C430C|nr:DUF3043 domain-containing protein [Yinghuangia seranimata]MDI2131163.1 DUF3043 domain-containing protein [Yinghuangia seranimata]
MFRRRSQAESESVETVATVETDVRDPQAPKGRPTPKRSEAQANRKTRVAPPKDRREAAKVARQRAREDREAQRTALVTGDERGLPARDKGPVRRFCRDFVDSRFTAAEFFLPSAVLILIMSIMPNTAIKNISLLAWAVVIVLIILDSVRVNFSLKRQLRTRFPDASLKGCTPYALMRALQMRRLRLPKPQVKRGEAI